MTADGGSIAFSTVAGVIGRLPASACFMENVVDAFSVFVITVTVIRSAAIGAYYNIIAVLEFFTAHDTTCTNIF